MWHAEIGSELIGPIEEGIGDDNDGGEGWDWSQWRIGLENSPGAHNLAMKVGGCDEGGNWRGERRGGGRKSRETVS